MVYNVGLSDPDSCESSIFIVPCGKKKQEEDSVASEFTISHSVLEDKRQENTEVGAVNRASTRKCTRNCKSTQHGQNHQYEIYNDGCSEKGSFSTTSMAERLIGIKKSYVKSREMYHDRNGRLYQHGKRGVSVRRLLDEAKHKELNKHEKFEEKFQQRRKQSRSLQTGSL